MKKIIICLAFLTLLASCSGDKKTGSFELKGNFTNSNGETIYLEKLSGQQPVVVDSTIINEKGDFEFSNYNPKIGFYRIKQSAQNFAMLVLDTADKVKVTGDLKDLGNSYKVEGSEETKLFIEYNEIAKKREMKLDSLNKVGQMLMSANPNDQKRMDSISKSFEAPYNEIMEISNELIIEKLKGNTNKYASLMSIQALDPDKFPDIYKSLDEGLSKTYPYDKNIKMFHDFVSKMLATTIGQPAPEINLASPDGKEIALSSLKGKVVLIDFWASWCKPCLGEMPNVVKAYKKYKDKGFEIYGVSLDQDKQRWIESIAKEGITWPQVSDLKQWQSDVVKLYSIQSIPLTILLDRDGKIIDKNLRGEALDKKLAEVLN